MIETLLSKIKENNIDKLKNEIHIYYASQKLNDENIDSLRALLSNDEIERSEKFYFEKDRKYYIASRGMLRVILSKYLKKKCDEIQFTYNKYGKPEVDSEFKNISLEFNLSHSSGKVIYALSNGRKIGVDIEKIRPIQRTEQIVNSFFSEKEKEEFNSLPEDLKDIAFWNCWTRKEAYIKAHGKGLSIPLDQFSVSLLGGKINLEHDINGIDESINWSISDVKINNQFISAVAYYGNDLSIECEELL